ncbi:MAG: hypothetical protein A2W28_05245 [Gammaproteobacteria bacterium RBG_16_51_14]|nr:MAG: hypothetical protein A2W28_05245 [Gammaproteobacteria bacterium RBG_16_51_14]
MALATAAASRSRWSWESETMQIFMGARFYLICRHKRYNECAFIAYERRRIVIVRMTAKGLLSIPLEILRKFGMKEGTRVHVDVNKRGYKIILTPVTREYIQRLRGKYKGKGLLKALVAEKKRAVA